MVLVTNQSSHVTFPSRSLSWNRGEKLKQHMAMLHTVKKTERCITLKHAVSLRIGSACFREPRQPLKISSFKGTVQNDGAMNGSSKSKVPQNHIKTSYICQEGDESLAETSKLQDAEAWDGLTDSKGAKNPIRTSYVCQDDEETLAKSSKLQDAVVSCVSSTANMTESRLELIRILFTKWLTLLLTQFPGHVGDEIIEDPQQSKLLQARNRTHAVGRGEILKMVLCYFLGLDATIKIPLMIFIPLYLAVNLVYGAEVSSELTPLWIIGPLIVALYVKMLRWLLTLYVFCFKKTVMVFKNLPAYSVAVYKYIVDGKLEADIRAQLLQPILNVKNLNYKELSAKKWKEFEERMREKYLDFVESIWPYYCRTVRFLKKANLI
ncbi:hypothetical protein Nepgr_032048 [Nepenthes gracilis]|uniref:Uncharacterized protein n=1 Tax=Nepenthes gracilis TaxID=150966 RepID=A0AAD3TIK1_NEPGR|nr:hypothetical protein Nepgr_032048 [Nepenthes gracilis]